MSKMWINPFADNNYQSKICPNCGQENDRYGLPIYPFNIVKSLRKEPLIAGLIVGIVSGIFMVEYTNHFGALTSSLFNIPIFGSLYVAVIALAINLIISFGGSFIMNKKRSALLQIKSRNT